MKLKLFCLSLLAIVLFAVPASAQSSPVTYTLKVYNSGATVPFQTSPAPASAVVCNLTPTPAGTAPVVVNPTKVEFDDPANAGKACQIDFAQFLGGLPANVTNTATLSYVDSLGIPSGESNVSNPFVRAVAGPAPAHLRVVGGK